MSVIHRCEDDQGANLIFTVCRTKPSRWLVSTPDQSIGGFFRSAEDAKRFARDDVRLHRHGEVVVISDDCLDVEVFEQAHRVGVFHLDTTRQPAAAERAS